MNTDQLIRLFGLNNLSIEAEVRRVEIEHDIDLGHRNTKSLEPEDAYYPQFSERLRQEASEMAAQYAIFYCLENSIREIIVQRLEDAHGATWWDLTVPETVRRNAASNQARERSSGITPRSTDLIDYTNFGELGEIIKANQTIFGDMLRDIRAVERILANLNTLRAPIAHCKALAEDEVLRLHLSLRDWFRQME